MDATSLLTAIAPGAEVREITAGGGDRRNRVFRLLEESGRATVVKVYANPGRERRERHALNAVADIEGVPRLVDRGITPDGTAWARLTDGGAWSLRSLTKNLDAIRNAGRVLADVHASTNAITNLEGGMDGDYIAAHYRSTIERLERYRRKLQIAPEILEAAGVAPPPESSKPVTAHTHPTPDKFLVSESGSVMLVDWEWATLAPPEWDVSLATHTLEQIHGPDAIDAFLIGYDATMPKRRLESWTAYHIAVQLLEAGESRDGRLSDLQTRVQLLAKAVGVA